MQFVTIATKNYLPAARTLAESITEHHPKQRLLALIVDADEGEAFAGEPFDAVTPFELPLKRDAFLRMALMYDAMELSASMKPWIIELALNRGAETVVYLDADICVYGSFDAVEPVAKKAGIVLTPHNIHPIPRDGMTPTEMTILAAGTFNTGFVAVSERGRAFVEWWKERLSRDSIIDQKAMLFVDQRWMDLVPGYWDTVTWRDPGYNVAYWNLAERNVESSEGGAGTPRYTVSGRPLVFFHFSGFSPAESRQLSRYQDPAPRAGLPDNPAVGELVADYARRLKANGWTKRRKHYVFGEVSPGDAITPFERRLYRSMVISAELARMPLPAVPFSGDTRAAFASQTAPLSGQPLVNGFMLHLWHARPDLQRAFPDPAGADARAFSRWATRTGIAEGSLKAWQVPDPTARVAPKITRVRTRGVNLHGYFTAELGMGELGRLVVQSVEASGLPCSTVVNSNTVNRQRAEFTGRNETVRFPVDVAVFNAFQAPTWFREMDERPGRRLRRPVAGVWAWEVEEFPDENADSLKYVDEVWTISTFARDAIQKKTNKPVFALPIPKPATVPGSPASRRPKGQKPYFLAMFDYLSSIDRKNPFAAINAFVQAFGEDDSVELIVKTINAYRRPEDHARLIEAVGGRPNIRILTDYLTREELAALMAGPVAYVSLHRAEGYGLTCAEAMALGVPVIATNYSGNLDFMSHDDSLLVDYTLIPVVDTLDIYPDNAVWAEANVEQAAGFMRRLFDDPAFAEKIGDAGRQRMAASQELEQAGAFINERVDVLMKLGPQPVAHDDVVAKPPRRRLRLRDFVPGRVKRALRRLV